MVVLGATIVLGNKCNLLIAHHPIIFKGLKKINNDSLTDKLVIKAIKNNIAIYSIHTNWFNCCALDLIS